MNGYKEVILNRLDFYAQELRSHHPALNSEDVEFEIDEMRRLIIAKCRASVFAEPAEFEISGSIDFNRTVKHKVQWTEPATTWQAIRKWLRWSFESVEKSRIDFVLVKEVIPYKQTVKFSVVHDSLLGRKFPDDRNIYILPMSNQPITPMYQP